MLGLPLMMTSMSGKVGGIVASHNKGGAYFRQRSVPVNPNTSFQQAVRGNFSSLAPRWSDELTDDERDEWETYATNVSVTNRIGATINLSGVNWYIAGNSLKLQAGLPIVDGGPSPQVLTALTEPSVGAVTAATNEVDVSYDNGDFWARTDGCALLCYGSRPVSAGRKAPAGGYRLMGTVDGDTATPPTSPATFTMPFSVSEGQKVFFRFIAVTADGRKSPSFRTDALVGA